MPKFRMTYPYARIYPTSLGRVEPGQEITAKENPDPNHFEEVEVRRGHKAETSESTEPAANDTALTKES